MAFPYRPALILLLIASSAATAHAQSALLRGTVTDASDGQVLPGASVILQETGMGTASDADGRFVLTGIRPGAYTVRISFTGYQSHEAQVALEAGQTHEMNVALVPGIDLDPVQVTAGRHQEKLLDAPASIDVIGAREIETDVVAPTVVKALRNVTALDMVQTGVDRHEVVLRGFNDVFGRSTYTMTDYRRANAASIGVNLHSVMPVLGIDIDRVEVVRGPGSALYGAGVDTGVIHYISKDAFTHPGATLSISGGEQSLLNFQGRVATVVANQVGLKLTGSYASANDFELQACDQALLDAQLFTQCPDPDDAVQLFVDGVRDSEFKKFTLAGAMDWRLGRNTTLSINSGVVGLSGTLLSGVGTVQGDGFRGSYAQVRLSSGGLFLQGYVNSNDSGNSRVYGGDPVVEYSEEYSAQAQYSFGIGSREDVILGVDLELNRPDTRGTVLGRNEDNDNVNEFGAYVQSSTRLSDRVALTMALRGDYNNIQERILASPRLGLVVKPARHSSIRATYNRSFSSPTPTTYFLDLVAATLPGDIKVRARGGAGGLTYDRNPEYLALGAPNDLVASSLLPGAEGAPTPVGIDTGVIYRLMYEGLAAIPNDELARMLADAGLNIPLPLIDLLKDGLDPVNTPVSGFSPGMLALLNLSKLTVDTGLADLNDIDPVKETISQVYELGYKGIIEDKVLLAVDAYYAKKKDFVGPLQTRTPFVMVPGLAQDLVRDIAAGIASNATIADALGLFNLTPQTAAQMLVDLAGGDLPDSQTPVALVQPIENNPGVGQVPELMLGYPSFGNISYYGLDVSLTYVFSERLLAFANASWISDDFFDHTEVNEQSDEYSLALNAPGFKLKLGGSYRQRGGMSIHLSGRFTKGFPVISGPYIGDVENHFVLDAGVGYAFDQRGLRADLGVLNALGSDHREFVGAPKLGRVASVRLTYAMDWD